MKVDVAEQELLTQIRVETGELFKLYNFFFSICSALFGLLLLRKVSPDLMWLAGLAGFLVAMLWLWVFHKQYLWREYWIKRMRLLEESDEFRWWTKGGSVRTWDVVRSREFYTGMSKLWIAMGVLPVLFAMCFGAFFCVALQ